MIMYNSIVTETLFLLSYLIIFALVGAGVLSSCVVFSKQPKLGLTQELSSRISESTTDYTFYVWDLLLPLA